MVDKEEKKEVFRPEDLKEMFDRVYNYHDQVEKMLEHAYSHLGFSPEYIKNFIENPDNFTTEQYQKIQVAKRELLKKIEGAVDPKFRKKIKKINESSANGDKTRKGKTLGSRKRWIQM